jgi:hypothetical protein
VKNHFFYNHDIKYSEGILSVHYLIKKLTKRFAPPYFRTQEGSRILYSLIRGATENDRRSNSIMTDIL